MKNSLSLLLMLFSCLPLMYGKERVSLSLASEDCMMGDTIFCEAMVSSDESVASKVLYLELLAPEGYVKARQILPVRNGKASSWLIADSVYSTGVFEVRAYTRYGLAQSADAYDSKVIPIYEVVNGKKTMCDRKRKKNADYSHVENFSVTPEQGISLRGRLVNTNKNLYKTADIPLTASFGGKILRTKTDNTGQFVFDFGDVTGEGDMTVVYDFHFIKKKPCIILDRLFSPVPKPYGAEADSLAKKYVLISQERFKNELRPSIWISAKEVMNDYYDTATDMDYFYGDRLDHNMMNVVMYILYDRYYMTSGIGGVRFVNFKEPYHFRDSLRETHYMLHDGNDETYVENYQYIFISTDKNICEKLSYSKYPPSRLEANVQNKRDRGPKIRIDGVGHTGSSYNNIPSCIVFFIPYPKGTPMFERPNFTTPYIRHVTFHGFSKM